MPLRRSRWFRDKTFRKGRTSRPNGNVGLALLPARASSHGGKLVPRAVVSGACGHGLLLEVPFKKGLLLFRSMSESGVIDHGSVRRDAGSFRRRIPFLGVASRCRARGELSAIAHLLESRAHERRQSEATIPSRRAWTSMMQNSAVRRAKECRRRRPTSSGWKAR